MLNGLKQNRLFSHFEKSRTKVQKNFFFPEEKYSVFPISISLHMLEKEGELLCFLEKKKLHSVQKSIMKNKIKLKGRSWNRKKSADAAVVKHAIIVDLFVYLFCVPPKVQLPDTWSSPSHPPYQASHLLPLPPLDMNEARPLAVSHV